MNEEFDEKMINAGNVSTFRKKRIKVNYGRIGLLLFIVVLLITSIVYAVIMATKKPVDKEQDNIETDPVEEIILPKPWEVLSDNEMINPLSGMPITKEQGVRRSVIVSINNAQEALPQSGLSKADVIYEIPVEGELVRLLALFQDLDTAKIGPVRSARHSMLSYAFDNNAIFVHYGVSPKTTTDIKAYNSPSLDGLSYLDSTMFTTDKTRKAPHDKFTSGTGILAGWAKVNYKKENKEEYRPMFQFANTDEAKFDAPANNVKIEYSYYQHSEFKYNTTKALYTRHQFGAAQVDALGTDETFDDIELEYKNVLILFQKVSPLVEAGKVDKEGRKDIVTIGSGDGIYMTNGTQMAIKWSKKDIYTPTVYTDPSGRELELNRGKTWISIVPNTFATNNTLEGDIIIK